MYVLIEDGKVAQEFGSVPDSLKNISGFYLLSPEEQAAQGFYPIEESKPTFKDNEKLVVKSEEVVKGIFLRTYTKTKKSPEELSSDLSAAKSQALYTLSANYSTTINSNISYLGSEFKADPESRKIIAECVASSGGIVPDNFGWLGVNNVKIAMTFTELQGLAQAIFLRGQGAFENLQVKKTLVRNAKTISEVKGISW